MEISNKELVLKEISMIIKLDRQYDLSNPEIAKKTYIFIKQKNVFKTPAGARLIQRLERNSTGAVVKDTCIFCGKNPGNNKLLCDTCVNKYSVTEKTKTEEHKAVPKKKKASKGKKIAVLIILGVVVLGGLSYIAGLGEDTDSPGDKITQENNENITGEQRAQVIVKNIFPEDDGWSVRFGGTKNMPIGAMETPIGKSTYYQQTLVESSQDPNLIQEFYSVQVTCWVFTVQKNGPDTVQSGIVTISPDGKIFCQGQFEGFPSTELNFRIE